MASTSRAYSKAIQRWDAHIAMSSALRASLALRGCLKRGVSLHISSRRPSQPGCCLKADPPFLTRSQMPVGCVTVIHLLGGWVILVKMKSTLNSQESRDFRAVLNELGIPYFPLMRVNMALSSLSAGESPIDVMRRYHVVVVSHGSPNREEIKVFQQQFIKGLRACPKKLS